MKKKKQKGLKLKLFKQGGLSNNWVQYQGLKELYTSLDLLVEGS